MIQRLQEFDCEARVWRQTKTYERLNNLLCFKNARSIVIPSHEKVSREFNSFLVIIVLSFETLILTVSNLNEVSIADPLRSIGAPQKVTSTLPLRSEFRV